MSTTRSQKRKNNPQESTGNVIESLVSPIVLENVCQPEQDVCIASPSIAKSPRVENSFLESLRASLKEEITSEIKSLLIESQKELLRLLRTKTGENVRENFDEEQENATRNFYTPTTSMRINSTKNDEPTVSRNMVTEVLNDYTNQPKRPNKNKVPASKEPTSQPASKERPTVARTLLAPDENDGSALPMPKALTASLPTFDGKSEKFELFEDLLPNNIKMYPHLTEIQKNKLFPIPTPRRCSADVL